MNIKFKSYGIAIIAVLVLLAAINYWYSGSRADQRAEYAELLQEGIELYEQSDYPAALERLQQIPPAELDDWRLHYYIGSAHMMQKEYAVATEALERALAMDSQQSGVLYALGVCSFKQGNLALAKAYFASILEINPYDEHAKGLMDIIANLERQQPKSSSDPED